MGALRRESLHSALSDHGGSVLRIASARVHASTARSREGSHGSERALGVALSLCLDGGAGLRRAQPVSKPTALPRSSRTTSVTASRPSSRSAQATFSASATYSDTGTPPPPTSTFMRGVARPSPSFWDNIRDKSTVSGKDTGTPRAATPRHHSSARNRTQTCTP